MKGFCAGGGDAVTAVRALLHKVPKPVEEKLTTIEQCLNGLHEHVLEGLYRYCIDHFHYDWADPKELCQHVLDMMFGDSKALRQTKDWDVKDLRHKKTKRTIPCYPFGVKRMLFGLVENADNAIARCKRRRRIYLFVDTTTRGGRRYARIRVVDDGPGMPPAARSTIFEGRFSTRKGRRGLGAQNVADGARDHHGFIEVASTEGKGTVVGILLPAPTSQPEDLGGDKGWLESYIKLASQYPLVTRSDLESLLARDKSLRAWYGAGKGKAS